MKRPTSFSHGGCKIRVQPEVPSQARHPVIYDFMLSSSNVKKVTIFLTHNLHNFAKLKLSLTLGAVFIFWRQIATLFDECPSLFKSDCHVTCSSLVPMLPFVQAS